jgi:hypothetical protein
MTFEIVPHLDKTLPSQKRSSAGGGVGEIGVVPNPVCAMRRGPYRFFMQDKRQVIGERMEKGFHIKRGMLKGKFVWAPCGGT